jgi:ABC-2 type transport system ATP-binding protein
VLVGPVEQLARDVLGGGFRILVEAEGAPDLEAALGRLEGVTQVRREGPARFVLDAAADMRAAAARAVVDAGGRLLALTSEAPSLEEIYARYFQKEAAHAGAA